ncbi:SsrA-binding protein SmpB [Candidatus Gracilibacteria bacterium]|nr:SsrA-binding protein SmpB [Candidatus Gracilibacteria bacterium]
MTQETAKKPEFYKLINKNKKAYFDYEVLEKIEAGIKLTGAEVKSVKESRVQLKGSYVKVRNGKVVVENMHITAYRYGNQKDDYNPLHDRLLLVKKEEVELIADKTAEKGLTVIPLEIYQKNSLIKLLIGICRGKKVFDKRHIIKEREVNRQINRSIKQ